MDDIKIVTLAAAALLLLCQSTWLYTDSRHRSRYPWLWAIWGLIQFPMPLIFYWFIVRIKKCK
ncbi:hypothetical protein PALU110988_20440 [Paenibacillus lupini]|uniref:hypothetical protein n=1 Tax=Paenibacillus lupini TaxID=1450204 RepID=UPI00141E3350|nr:hypothetical protein [Paenibacillus lupini]NIK21831.1 hypothetical protein [Paenibacillus lupini]